MYLFAQLKQADTKKRKKHSRARVKQRQKHLNKIQSMPRERAAASMSPTLCRHFYATLFCALQYQRKHCNCVKQTTDCTSQTYKALFMDCEQLLCYSNPRQNQTERGGKEEPRKRGDTIVVEVDVGQELHIVSC